MTEEKANNLTVGNSLGRYRILRQLGAGGMGEVYLAEDTRLHRKVALKVLPENIAADKERLQRFEQEARAASSLNHPNILTVYEALSIKLILNIWRKAFLKKEAFIIPILWSARIRTRQ
jgi:serine/threonine protein kinase